MGGSDDVNTSPEVISSQVAGFGGSSRSATDGTREQPLHPPPQPKSRLAQVESRCIGSLDTVSALTACCWRAAGGGKGGERESRGADEPRPSPPRTVQGPYSAPLLPTLTPLGVLAVLASSLEAGGAMTKVCWTVDCRSVHLDLPPDRPCDRLPTASGVPTASRPTSLLPPSPSPRT